MESQDTTAVPAQSPAKVKGRDFEPPLTTSQIQPDDQASGPPKPYDIDPADNPQGDGKPQH
jgi:hypothetical protein